MYGLKLNSHKMLGKILTLLILFFSFAACNLKNETGKVFFNYSLPLVIDNDTVKDKDVILKFNKLIYSDSIVIRFMSEFNLENVRLSMGNFFAEELDSVQTNFSIGYATSISIPKKYFKQLGLKINIRGYTYYIPFNDGYHYIDLYFNKKFELITSFNNTIPVLS